MRRFLLLGLCLALALQGAAQAGVLEKFCPMQRAGQAQATQAGNSANDCCNSADTGAKTGKVCKTGQACSSAGAWLINQAIAPPFRAVAVSLVSSRELFAFCIDPGGRWRPPALS